MRDDGSRRHVAERHCIERVGHLLGDDFRSRCPGEEGLFARELAGTMSLHELPAVPGEMIAERILDAVGPVRDPPQGRHGITCHEKGSDPAAGNPVTQTHGRVAARTVPDGHYVATGAITKPVERFDVFRVFISSLLG
jgi:hypothetical protein